MDDAEAEQMFKIKTHLKEKSKMGQMSSAHQSTMNVNFDIKELSES